MLIDDNMQIISQLRTCTLYVAWQHAVAAAVAAGLALSVAARGRLRDAAAAAPFLCS